MKQSCRSSGSSSSTGAELIMFFGRRFYRIKQNQHPRGSIKVGAWCGRGWKQNGTSDGCGMEYWTDVEWESEAFCNV